MPRLTLPHSSLVPTAHVPTVAQCKHACVYLPSTPHVVANPFVCMPSHFVGAWVQFPAHLLYLSMVVAWRLRFGHVLFPRGMSSAVCPPAVSKHCHVVSQAHTCIRQLCPWTITVMSRLSCLDMTVFICAISHPAALGSNVDTHAECHCHCMTGCEHLSSCLHASVLSCRSVDRPVYTPAMPQSYHMVTWVYFFTHMTFLRPTTWQHLHTCVCLLCPRAVPR